MLDMFELSFILLFKQSTGNKILLHVTLTHYFLRNFVHHIALAAIALTTTTPATAAAFAHHIHSLSLAR